MKITFQSDGYTLAGNVFTAEPQKHLAFLFIQGWTGNQNIDAAQKVADLGFTSMTYDMRGNKDSQGDIAEFSRADFIKDATVAYDYLREQVGPDAKICVVGSSFGSYTAAILSNERDVYALSLRVPASYPDEGFTEPQMGQAASGALATWRKQPLSYDNKAFQAIHDFAGQVQVIEAENDEQVPHQAPQNYADAVADQRRVEHIVMKDAPHRLATSELNAEYQGHLTKWVSKVAAQ
jgi:esterase/lipase